ncbi:MAG: thiamine biosynthesis lipoprotein [Porticoccus sp.]|jgi:thiamine biosynthesis lipoprotein|tara:strand:+ start:195330 stop:196376 length:1047 start_codon:yes stop_codon:yes gene_type:complete
MNRLINRLKIKAGPMASFLFVTVMVSLLSACDRQSQLVFDGRTMGTTYQVKLVPSEQSVSDDLGQKIQSRLDSLNNTFTTYQQDSELMLLNRAPVGQVYAVSQDMLHVLNTAKEVHQLTSGAFDPTVGALVNLWGFGPENTGNRVPSETDIATELGLLGFNKLQITPDATSITRSSDIALDMSAVAKGYAVDAVAELLEQEGFNNYLVEVGGELRLKGVKANKDPWRIAIEAPSLERGLVQKVLVPGDAAVATSGDYRNYFEKDGKRYSHTIDPRTGYPLDHQLASVTIIAETAVFADALATGFMVLGADASLKIAEENKLAVYLLVKEGEAFKSYYSSAFAPFLSGD